MKIEWFNQSSLRLPKLYLQRWLQFVEGELLRQKVAPGSLRQKSLTVVFLDEHPAKELNRKFRGKNKATDILSFSPIEVDSLGELVLCSPVIQRQAKQHSLSFRDECCYMLLHGVLHLLGYEHEHGGAEAEEMLAIQDGIFAKIDKWRSSGQS